MFQGVELLQCNLENKQSLKVHDSCSNSSSPTPAPHRLQPRTPQAIAASPRHRIIKTPAAQHGYHHAVTWVSATQAAISVPKELGMKVMVFAVTTPCLASKGYAADPEGETEMGKAMVRSRDHARAESPTCVDRPLVCEGTAV